jgi:hypothetical protein
MCRHEQSRTRRAPHGDERLVLRIPSSRHKAKNRRESLESHVLTRIMIHDKLKCEDSRVTVILTVLGPQGPRYRTGVVGRLGMTRARAHLLYTCQNLLYREFDDVDRRTPARGGVS